ncbi:Dyp-type peroxidase [Streptomyces sp. MBT62]|uniref:Dyp-type peroxidase n=1 Tax=Streptomyces sp. MBT62 TaxID=2800410 RepID=UPI00190C8CFA|nr:Dyp-type peroxidase [Streptomyces sp. MBT62]MBK3567065.1 Dyp-type peroxidase [Streptomyces sp. MBT62]
MATATTVSLRDSAEIQGEILAGFKKDNVTLLFLKFGDAAAARSWLKDLVPRLATTQQVAPFNTRFSEARQNSMGADPPNLKATWVGLSLTYPGLQVLTGKQDLLPDTQGRGTIGAFVQGAAARSEVLGDVDRSLPTRWLFGADHNQVTHAVLTVASDSESGLSEELGRQQDAVSRAGIGIAHIQPGNALPGTRRGREHFGFKDGVSEPNVAGIEEHPEDGARLLSADLFVLGATGSALPKGVPEWMRNGSFQVVRRLAQDVPGWWAQVATELQKLKDAGVVGPTTTSEWLGSRLVGRWRCGASVHNHPDLTQDPNSDPDNVISYKDDPHGVVTPLFSHLRKTNPRDGLIDGELIKEEVLDPRRIIRRGIPYGAPFDPASAKGGPDEPRGLLFVCYQADLVRQFEFMQRNWVNTHNFPPGRAPDWPGPDPMAAGKLSKIGDQDKDYVLGDVSFASRNGGAEPGITKLNFRPFVHTEGSVYAFTPSLATLRRLTQGRVDGADPGGGGGQTGTSGGSGGQTTTPDGGQTVQTGPVDELLPWPDTDGKYWLFSERPVRILRTGSAELPALTTDASDDRTALVTESGAELATWDALRGVERVDAIWPVPDEQGVNGESSYWVFHTRGGTQYYRRIYISHNAAHTSRSASDDLPLNYWTSLRGVTRVDAVLPVPDEQRVRGASQFWLFHSTPRGQLYRLVSVADGTRHSDTLVRDDGDLSYWRSLNGVTKVDAFRYVPGRFRANGQSECWVFHERKYRMIRIADGYGHQDVLARDDRPNTPWFRRS